MQVQIVIPCLAFLVASIQAVSITQSFEEAQEEWKQFEQYFGKYLFFAQIYLSMASSLHLKNNYCPL